VLSTLRTSVPPSNSSAFNKLERRAATCERTWACQLETSACFCCVHNTVSCCLFHKVHSNLAVDRGTEITKHPSHLCSRMQTLWKRRHRPTQFMLCRYARSDHGTSNCQTYL
jgi:hypothetical protein